MGDMMGKRISDYDEMRHDSFIDSYLGPEKWLKEERIYYQEDVLDHDPREICPRCEEETVKSVNKHCIDGSDYECTNCNLSYIIMDFTREEGDSWMEDI